MSTNHHSSSDDGLDRVRQCPDPDLPRTSIRRIANVVDAIRPLPFVGAVLLDENELV